MKKYIEKVRAKEEHERKRILFLWLIIFMSIIFVIWFYTLGTRFDKKVKEQSREDIKPFKMFGDSISETFSGVNNSLKNVDGIKNEIKEAKESIDTE